MRHIFLVVCCCATIFVGSLGDFGCYIAAQTIFTNNDIGRENHLVLKGEDIFYKTMWFSQHAFLQWLGQGHDANIMTCKISPFLVVLHSSHPSMGHLLFVICVLA